MSVINLGRTTKTNIAFYQTDGMGRDGYITYNNGGFWKNRQIKIKDIYNPRKKITLFRSLFHQPAPFTYISDGSGRDSYVIEHNGGLVKTFEPLAKQKLIKFLRKNEEEYMIKHKLFLTRSQREYIHKIKKIQDNVINRLYSDSLEKIRKKNLKNKNKSLNDLLIKNNGINSLSGHITPLTVLHNKRSISLQKMRQREKENIEQQRNTSLNSNLLPKRNIFEKMINKNNTVFKENSAQTFDLYNKNNRKIKVLKKIKINSPHFDILNSLHNLHDNKTNDDLLKSDDNNLLKSYKNFNPNYQFRKINKNKIFGNNTLGSPNINNLHKVKYNFNSRKANDSIKSDYFKHENFSMNDINKDSNLIYEY